MSLAEREREYSPSVMVGGDLTAILADYRDTSARIRARFATTTHCYGAGADDLLDLHMPADHQELVPLHFFIHGGYWQELGRLDSSFMAGPLLDRGAAVAVVDYTLAPKATLDTMIDQCRRAVRWCGIEGRRLGIDAKRIILSGSSAGAHLAAMVLTEPSPVVAAILFSGVFDLEPLIGTYINVAVGIDPETAARCSPVRLKPAQPVPVVVATGAIESQEFQRQSDELADRWRSAGCTITRVTVPGRHHFDVPLDLGRSESVVGRASLGFESRHP